MRLYTVYKKNNTKDYIVISRIVGIEHIKRKNRVNREHEIEYINVLLEGGHKVEISVGDLEILLRELEK